MSDRPTLGVVRSVPRPASSARRCRCGVASEPRAHHDHLLRIERDPTVWSELLELALRWAASGDIDRRTLHPDDWETFARAHDWVDPERVHGLFDLAAEIASGSGSPLPLDSVPRLPLHVAGVRYISDDSVVAGEL